MVGLSPTEGYEISLLGLPKILTEEITIPMKMVLYRHSLHHRFFFQLFETLIGK